MTSSSSFGCEDEALFVQKEHAETKHYDPNSSSNSPSNSWNDSAVNPKSCAECSQKNMVHFTQVLVFAPDLPKATCI